MALRRPEDDPVWPRPAIRAWQPTLITLHMWLQVVGRLKLALTPFLNEWWNVTFVVTARGLTTGAIPFDQRMFQVNFDFIDHQVSIEVSDGSARSMRLQPLSGAEFYRAFMQLLESLDIHVSINTHPMESDNTIPFEQDSTHAEYDALYVNRCWSILMGVARVLERYRTPFVGKSSSVHFWWGSFDLATTRYSGRPAPPRHWPRGLLRQLAA